MGTYVQGQMVIVDKTALLQSGEITNMRRIANASNASIFCKVSSDNQSCFAIYKPIAGERPLWDFTTGNLASREYATFLIDRALGYNIVPETVLREGPFGYGVLQHWIDDIDEYDDQYLEKLPILRNIALLDVVINNTDRKISHLLFKGDKIYGCDHGVTFHEDFKLRTVLWQFAGDTLSNSEIIKLQTLIKELPNELNNYLSKTEILALEERIKNLLDTKKFPQPSTEWPAIPWPPF